ncbi:hypothetical protein H4R35_003688 [Dimargaris xerosporica]|nr:hypothetical protein H4R35_003688 [Dimargaris xerosporica]
MKLPIALAVLTAVASTYASPMPEGQGQVQTTSVAPMTSDEFVLRFQPFCEKLLFGGDGTLDKIKSKFEELYRKIDDYEDEEQMLRVMCAHIISITPTVASSQLGSEASALMLTLLPSKMVRPETINMTVPTPI